MIMGIAGAYRKQELCALTVEYRRQKYFDRSENPEYQNMNSKDVYDYGP